MKKLCMFVALMTLSLNGAIELTNDGKGDAWRKKVFNHIFHTKHWWDGESFSGPGSSLSATSTLRIMIPSIIKAIGARTLLDAGCGDFNWFKELIDTIELDYYVGIDIVEAVIAQNDKSYGAENRIFMCLDVAKDPLPKVDVILCRDCLAHLSYEDIVIALKNFKRSGSTYLLASSYSVIRKNSLDIRTGDFRSVNLQVPPFNFPEPLMSIFELSSEENMVRYGKRLCLWRIADLPIED